MTTESELSGVDLARQAREAAKRNGATSEKPQRRTGTAVRRDGRAPVGLGAAIGMMMTERGLVAPAAGGSVLARFEAILATAVPELVGRVQAVAFDVDTGRLDIVFDAPACGTKLRWIAPKPISAANEKVRGANVRALHVLAPTPVKAGLTAAAADPGPQPTTPAVPVGRRTPLDDHRRAIEAPGRPALPDRPCHRGGDGAADRRDAGFVPPGLPRCRRRRGRRTLPDRAGSPSAARPGHSD
ncbi:DUF721 domain-containing protein [Streptomyces sp. NPDC014734]|uniref:DUF721 domain-containing protein n=1 Tax=Streptomyces sp. NPDC014734 TaxID=3364886 RepID=UPI0036F69F39